jgi:hypothetical protein
MTTIQKKREDEDELCIRHAEAVARAAEESEAKKRGMFDSVLSSLQDHGYTLGELLYVSDPIYKQGIARWEGLFRDRSLIGKLLDLWSSQSSVVSREQIHTWAINYVSKEVKHEARAITESGFLQTLHRPVNMGLVLGFDVSTMEAYFMEHGSVFMQVFRSFATSARQLRKASTTWFAKKMTVRHLILLYSINLIVRIQTGGNFSSSFPAR